MKGDIIHYILNKFYLYMLIGTRWYTIIYIGRSRTNLYKNVTNLNHCYGKLEKSIFFISLKNCVRKEITIYRYFLFYLFYQYNF